MKIKLKKQVKKPLSGYERVKRYRQIRQEAGWKVYHLICPPELHKVLRRTAHEWTKKNSAW
jgi:hypothetical protein